MSSTSEVLKGPIDRKASGFRPWGKRYGVVTTTQLDLYAKEKAYTKQKKKKAVPQFSLPFVRIASIERDGKRGEFRFILKEDDGTPNIFRTPTEALREEWFLAIRPLLPRVIQAEKEAADLAAAERQAAAEQEAARQAEEAAARQAEEAATRQKEEAARQQEEATRRKAAEEAQQEEAAAAEEAAKQIAAEEAQKKEEAEEARKKEEAAAAEEAARQHATEEAAKQKAAAEEASRHAEETRLSEEAAVAKDDAAAGEASQLEEAARQKGVEAQQKEEAAAAEASKSAEAESEAEAGAEAAKQEEEAAKQEEEEEEAARQKEKEDEAARQKEEEAEATRQKAAEEEAVKVAEEAARQEEAAAAEAAKKAEEEARQKEEDEEAARQKEEEEEAAKQKEEEEEAARQKEEEKEAARQKEEEAEAARQKEEAEAEAARQKDRTARQEEDEAAREMAAVKEPASVEAVDEKEDETQKEQDGEALTSKHPLIASALPPLPIPAAVASDVASAASGTPPGTPRTPRTRGLGVDLRTALLAFCQERTASYSEVNITCFEPSEWTSGFALCALTHSFLPNAIDMEECSRASDVDNLGLAFDVAEDELGFTSSLDEDEVKMWTEKDIVEYVGQFYVLLKMKEKEERAEMVADLASKMEWGDPWGEHFDLELPENPRKLKAVEARQHTMMFMKGFNYCVEGLRRDDYDGSFAQQRAQACAALDDRCLFTPVPETDVKGGYFQEEVRQGWASENHAMLVEAEARLHVLQSSGERDAEAIAWEEANISTLQSYGNVLLQMAGTIKSCEGGTLKKIDEVTKEAQRRADAREKEREEAAKVQIKIKKELCRACGKVVYGMEKAEMPRGCTDIYHRTCFRCTTCHSTIKGLLRHEEYKGKIYCSKHAAEAKLPSHEFGDPCFIFFDIDKPSDPSGILWSWEVTAAIKAYSTRFNACIALIAEATTDEVCAQRAEKCRVLDDMYANFKLYPETDERGTMAPPALLAEWQASAQKELRACQRELECNEDDRKKRVGRARRQQARRNVAVGADMASLPTRADRQAKTRFLQGTIEDLKQYLRVLIKLQGGHADAVGLTGRSDENAGAAPSDLDMGGSKHKCFVCQKRVYDMELMEMDGLVMHRLCFKCVVCGRTLNEDTYEVKVHSLLCPRDNQLVPEEKLPPKGTSPPQVEAGMECTNCGNVLPVDRKFCSECGTKVTGGVTETFEVMDAKKFTEECKGMDREIRAKIESKFDVVAEKRVRAWIETVLGEQLEGDFHDVFKSGVVLCRLVNAIKDGSVDKIHTSSLAFKQMENIGNFVKVSIAWGVSQLDVFQTVDLFEAQNLNTVITTLEALDRTLPGVNASCPRIKFE